VDFARIGRILAVMKFHRPHCNSRPTAADIVGIVILAALVAWTFWVLLKMVPYHEIPLWML
jgi:hypothetical protein